MIQFPLNQSWAEFLRAHSSPPQSQGATIEDYRARYVLPITDVLGQLAPRLQTVRHVLQTPDVTALLQGNPQAPFNQALSDTFGFTVPADEIWTVRGESMVVSESNLLAIATILNTAPFQNLNFGITLLGDVAGDQVRNALGGIIAPSPNLGGGQPYQQPGSNTTYMRIPFVAEDVTYGPNELVALALNFAFPGTLIDPDPVEVTFDVEVQIDRSPVTAGIPWPPERPEA